MYGFIQIFIVKNILHVVAVLGLFSIIQNDLHAGIDRVWGNTLVCSITSKHTQMGLTMESKDKFYFGKNGERIYSPISADMFDVDRGAVYTLGRQNCESHRYSNRNIRMCNEFKIQGDSVVLMEKSHDKGIDDVKNSTHTFTIRFGERGNVKLTGRSSTTTNLGAVGFKHDGTCELIKGRVMETKVHTRTEQIECCIETIRKACLGNSSYVPKSICTSIRSSCSGFIDNGTLYCAD